MRLFFQEINESSLLTLIQLAMKASVQYNDFVGTAAADISDHTSLNEFLGSRGVDLDRYNAIGSRFYANYNDGFRASIICVDNQKSSEKEKYIVSLSFEEPFDKDEFFDLFKRFEVLITVKNDSYQDQEINDEVIVDDREITE
ncbi:hypothetical protein [Chlorobium limicola]|uniref:Uncharacterized protein n=1 Tax=Chlorobium limicola TaxID=1092 RepID=A0A101JN69_CHLLI|nr:hypothetical protein [Chlorobium limicola]KUL29918.1 hypothetical protein ASB62_04900 [Chlorobium limicola]